MIYQFRLPGLQEWLRRCFFLLLTASLPGAALAQQLVTGKVSAGGASLPGVIIRVQGGAAAAQSDSLGHFSIRAAKGSTLIFNLLGFRRQSYQLGNQANISIELEPDVKMLEGVAVIGYGTQKKRDLTGAVAVLKSDAYKDQPVLNASAALQGRVAGVSVTQSSGAPGAQAKIRIRGANSVSAANEPLYVVDGIALGSLGLQDININDIESMDVLKDASATAVYGSRGANGVVIITTRKGKAGTARVEYNTFISFNSPMKEYNLMDAVTYANIANRTAGAAIIPDPGAFAGKTTDWQGLLFNDAVTQNHQLSATGGTEKAKYYISAFYTDQQGLLINTRQKRFGFRSNIEARLTNRVSIGLNLSAQRINSHNNAVSAAKDNPVMASVTWAPTEQVYDDAAETALL